jgi:voltage-gated potassium channel Kch
MSRPERQPSAWSAFRARNHGLPLRQQVHALLTPGVAGGRLHELVDLFMVTWVLVAVVAVVLESVAALQAGWAVAFAVVDALAVAVFCAEYLLRLYASAEDQPDRPPWRVRLRAAFSPAMVVDLLAIVPFFIEAYFEHLVDLRFLRVFRLLRLVKLTRYTGATRTLSSAVKREWPMIATSAFIMLLLVVLAASLGFLFEHEAQPDKFENIPQSIYWAVITLASVGYGDIAPITPMGRFVTVVLALLGIGIFAVPAAVLSSAFNDQLRRDREALQNELYRMLEDGAIDETEQRQIDREAARLHLSPLEVERILARARRQRRESSAGGLPWALIEREPVVACEQYRMLVAQLRQLHALMPPPTLPALLAREGTLLERGIGALLAEDAQSNGSVTGTRTSSDSSSTSAPGADRAT